MKTRKAQYRTGKRIRPDKIRLIYDIGFTIDEGLVCRRAGNGILRALVAGEGGVAAPALPPHSKIALGWQGTLRQFGHDRELSIADLRKLSQIRPDKTRLIYCAHTGDVQGTEALTRIARIDANHGNDFKPRIDMEGHGLKRNQTTDIYDSRIAICERQGGTVGFLEFGAGRSKLCLGVCGDRLSPLRGLGLEELWFSIRACLERTCLEESGAEATALQTLREDWEPWWVGGRLTGGNDVHERTGISHDFPTEIFSRWVVFASNEARKCLGGSGLQVNPTKSRLHIYDLRMTIYEPFADRRFVALRGRWLQAKAAVNRTHSKRSARYADRLAGVRSLAIFIPQEMAEKPNKSDQIQVNPTKSRLFMKFEDEGRERGRAGRVSVIEYNYNYLNSSMFPQLFRGRFDFGGRIWCTYGCCSRSRTSFLKAGAGDPNSSESRTGRTEPGDRFQGHFQGQARQLISQAFGRAILCSASAEAMVSPIKNYADAFSRKAMRPSVNI